MAESPSFFRTAPPMPRRWFAVGLLLLVGAGPVARGQENAEEGLTLLQALELMRRHDPNIALAEARLDSARGAVEVARGRFDPHFTASSEGSDSERPTAPGVTAESRALDTSTSLVTELRSGQEVTATVAVNRTEDPGSPDPALNLGTLSLIHI